MPMRRGLAAAVALHAVPILAILLLPSLSQPVEPFTAEEVSLAADDECAADDPACAFSALQLKAAKQVTRASAAGVEASVGADTDEEEEERPAAVGPEGEHFPLCAEDIVATTCRRVNLLTEEFFGTEADANISVVHAAELSEQLSVSRRSIIAFLRDFLAAPNLERDKVALDFNAFAVSCATLCQRTVDKLPASGRPPHSDVGCYVPAGKTEPRCDIDVSEATFRDLVLDLGSVTHEAESYAEEVSGQDDASDALPESEQTRPNTSEELHWLKEMHYPDTSMNQLAIAVANLFRIYPLVRMDVAGVGANVSHDISEEDLENDEEGQDVEGDTEEDHEHSHMALWEYHRRRRYFHRRRSPEAVKRESQHAANWKDEVQRVNVKAQAYTATALRNVNRAAARSVMLTWFGNTATRSQQEMRRVINGVHSLLSNVDYKYPGDRCKPNVYAYVYPKPPHNKNAKGQYIFNLCDLYMTSILQEQIATLTHEGSHHQTMSTDDVCFAGSGQTCQRAYGRSICKSLAQTQPDKALKNADNYCYFINDANKI